MSWHLTTEDSPMYDGPRCESCTYFHRIPDGMDDGLCNMPCFSFDPPDPAWADAPVCHAYTEEPVVMTVSSIMFRD